MKSLIKRAVSAILSCALLASFFTAYAAETGENNMAELQNVTYTCDFTTLIKDNAATVYGTASDVIAIDKYTTAYLTYEGTYVSTDGKVYLKGANAGKGAVTEGSYIEFTAPSDGTAVFCASGYNYYFDGNYTAYSKTENTQTVELAKGQKLQIGQRIDSTYISSLTFTAAPKPEEDTTGYTAGSFASGDTTVPYLYNKPDGENLPLLIYIHSKENGGDNNSLQLADAKYMFNKSFKNDNKAILLAPQFEESAFESGNIENTAKIINSLTKDFAQKNGADKIYIAGNNEGACAAWKAVADAPEQYSAIVSIAGTYELTDDEIEQAVNANIRVWAFQGYTDSATTYSSARKNISRLQQKGAEALYTEYPFDGQNITEKAVNDGAYSWLFDENGGKTVDLVLFSGQSNMAGRGDYDQATVCPPNEGFEYHSVTEPYVLSSVQEPLGKYENNTMHDAGSNGIDRRNGDMVSALMKAYYDKTGVPIVAVQASRGGTDTGYFTGDIMTEMQRRYNDAKTYLENSGYTVRKKFLVWCQGEADADKGRTDETYKNNTLSIFNNLKTGSEIDDFFIVRTGHYNINYGLGTGETPSETALSKDAEYLRISTAQKAIADENENVTVVASFYNDYSLSKMRDQYHYYQPVYNAVGKLAGENIAAYYDGGEVVIPDDISEEKSSVKSVKDNLPSIMNKGDSVEISISDVINSNDSDITDKATISDVTSDNADIISVNGNTVTANGSGTAKVSFTINSDVIREPYTVTKTVKSGVYEIVSSDTVIDVTGFENYGTDIYRVYNFDGEYKTVTASNGKIENTSGKEVVIVPVYKFNYTNSAVSGYTLATGTYNSQAGFGLENGGTYNTNENGSLPKDNPLKADLPYGFYDITVTRKGGCRADVYADGHQIINNTTSSGSQNRPSGTAVMNAPRMLIADGNINLTIGNTSGSNERVAYLEIAKVPDKCKKTTIWIAGDSESANYYPIDENGSDLESDKIMMTGFGMQLKYFMADKYNIANFGQPSATVKTWYDECFESVSYQVRKDDLILIDFGINEVVSSSNRISIDEMKSYMKNIVDMAKEKGARAVLVSPVYCGKYQSKAYFTYNPQTDNNAEAEFAEQIGADFIDLNKYLTNYLTQAAEETGDENWRTNNYQTTSDNLHMSQYGALLAASFISAGLHDLGYETTNYSYTYKDNSEVADGYLRGEPTGVTRVYSVANAYKLMTGKDMSAMPVSLEYNRADSSINAVSSDGTVKNAQLIGAVYGSDGVMSDIKIYPLEFDNMKAKAENIKLDENTRLFVWNSVEKMQPLSEVYTKDNIPSVGAEPTTAPTEAPGELIYSQDFEGYNAGDTAGWTSPAGTMAVKADSTDGIGKYQTVVSGKSGTCRSGYFELPSAVTEDFVFECDYRSSSNENVSDLELAESKNSIYANHGVYSNANFVFTMARPKNSDKYIINNKSDDSGFTEERYAAPIFSSGSISGNPWLHVKVVGDMTNRTVITYITSLDRKTEYYHGKTDMNVGRDTKINSWKCIHMLSPSKGADTCIDNIVVRKANKTELSPIFYTVSINDYGDEFKQYVAEGESAVNIPDVSAYGDSFLGWSVNNSENLLTSAQLAQYPISENSVINAVISDSYIEPLANVEFNVFPANNELVMGADENTYGDNKISLTITGDKGTSLVTNPDNRVDDYKIEWSFDGFRTLDGTPTGETGNVYCDSYGLVYITEKAQSCVNFKLKRTTANYYGRVTAKVTYNGKTKEVSSPLVLLADKTKDNSVILPKGGYTADFNKYENLMTGYNASSNDIVTGGWDMSGSDITYVSINSDSTGKYLSFSRNASGNSSYVHQNIGDIENETVFEQDIRFGMNAAVDYGADTAKGTSTAFNSTAFKLSFSDNKFSFNGADIGVGEKGKWYHIVITADKSSKLCNVKIYNIQSSGDYSAQTPIIRSGTVNFDASFEKGAYYRYTLNTKASGASIDVNNVKVTSAGIDEDSFTITAPQTAQIPSGGNTSVDLSASAKTVFGTDTLGTAVWNIDDEFADGVSISARDIKSAVLTVSAEAVSGDLPIRCTLNGKSKVVNIKLLGDKDNVVFVNAPAGIQIGSDRDYTFKAEVRNGNAETISDRTIKYVLYDENNTAKVNPTGVSIDEVTGVMTVTSSAQPQTIGVRAVSADSGGNEISKFIKVTLYNLKFSFGTAEPKNGYTQITSSTLYSDSRGYGIDGTAADGADGITGNGFTFKLKLEKGNVYEVTAKYQGTIRCERIDGKLTGFDRTLSSGGTDTYKVAVFGDDIMDISLPSGGQLCSVEVSKVVRNNASKPQWFTIGDSTVQQNGSWGYTIASDKTEDLSKYPELAKVCSTFYNSGKAGEQHANYYSNGRLNNILVQMNIGDVVSISGMGTNDASSTQEQFKVYDKAYADAIIDMGGYVIFGSYTPTGNYGATQGKVYDSDLMAFKGMRTNAYDLAIRDLYNDYKDNSHVLGFIDIGKTADEMMTNDVKAVYEKALSDGKSEDEARAAANAKADEMMGWWKDYNHYYTDFSNYILPSITKQVAELIGKIR